MYVQRAIALSLEADGMGVAISNSDDRPKSPLKRSAFGSGEGSDAAWGAARQSTLEAGQAVIHTDASGAERPAVVLRVRPAGQLRADACGQSSAGNTAEMRTAPHSAQRGERARKIASSAARF